MKGTAMNIRNTLLVAFALAAAAGAQTWNLDTTHTSIGFAVKHLAVSTVRGEFDRYKGTLVGDPTKPATLKADMTLDAASVNTKVEKRDEHVRNADFLDVAKFPTIEFKAEKTVVKGKALTMLGTLTLHGVSKKISIPFTVSGPVVDPWKNNRIGLEGSFTIKRSEYGIESFPGVVGDELKIEVSAEYIEAK
jgi:polyisoprenoid-binding protein YceI